jgi:hypothetical protein
MSEHDTEYSRLYRQASVETPSAALDAAILKAARDKLAKPTQPVRSYWSRWMAPAGLVATLVLGVYVTLLVERERPANEGMVVDRVEARKPAETKAGNMALESSPSVSIAEPPRQRSDKEETSGSIQKKDAPAPVQTAGSGAPRSAPTAAAPFPSLQPGMIEERALDDRNSVAVETRRAAALSAAPAAAGATGMLRSKAAARTPEARLDEIRRLKREGLDQEAAAQLESFRKEFPDYPVPKDLAP